MTLLTEVTEESPAEIVDALDRAGERRVTRAEREGDVVWRSWGRGRPLVLLHGGTGSWLHWVRNIEPLAREFLVIAPDLPGSGESGDPQRPITAERIGATLAAGLSEIIGAETPFALAGFSMGGLIAGYLLRAAGPRVHSLVLVGATATGAPRGEMAPLKSWRRLPSAREQDDVHRENLAILMIHDRRRIDPLAVYIQARNANQSRVRGKHVSHTGTLADCLPGMTGRLAGIWGEHDATAVPYVAERRQKLEDFRPGAPFDIVPGVGHWVQYEAHEAFNVRIAELVRANA